MKIKEMDASDIESRIHSQWHEWRKTEQDPTSTNKARVAKYQEEKVWKSFSILGKRPSSSEQPEDWTEDMSDFVRQSGIDSESLVSLIARFEIRYPQMTNRVRQAFFEFERGDVHLVSDNNTLFE